MNRFSTFRLKVVQAIDNLNLFVGQLAAWLHIPIIVIVVFDVIFRRFLDVGSVMLQELEWHLNGALVLFTMAYAYQRNVHVRIDICYFRIWLSDRGPSSWS